MTESGNHQSGMGHIQWWGFSPAIDFLNCLKPNSKKEVNILMNGAGDIRHILMTMSRKHRHPEFPEKINFYILENQIEIYARQMLQLLIISEPAGAYSVSTKSDLYLDILGNTLNRPFTSAYIKQKSIVMSEMVVDLSYASERADFINLELLKFKDRDRLDDQFKFWRDSSDFQVKKQWEIRQRQYLGARYDHRKGDHDWKVSMQFAELQASVITKHPYSRFREDGIAFEPFEEGSYTVPNKTISSSRVLANGKGDKNAFRGYWGDIIVGPYVCHGIESENEKLFKTANKLPTHSADQISRWNVNSAIHELFTSSKFEAELREDNFSLEEIDENESEISTSLVKRKETYKSVKMSNCKVHFISPESNNLTTRYFQNKFDAVFLSVSNSKKINQNIDFCLSKDGIVILETAKYILDLKKEQLQEHMKTVKQMANEANFEEIGISNILNTKIVFRKK